MKFGLMFFAASEDSLGPDKYRLVVESARFGDAAGFSSVWVPERHFTAFGGLYPNPAVLHAGLATCTQRIRLQAGSVVAPLHDAVRIAEDWAVVDNLSNGRVGVSFASGWNPDDFVLTPDRYADRNTHLIETMEAVRRLWRGEAFDGTNGVGQPASVRIFPKPVQPELPIWLTVAGNPRNFERAGACGAHVLTHLLDQDEDTLASKIALYRRAREAAGFDPATGQVSLMIHTLVGADVAVVREQARQPYCSYIKANIGLFKGLEQSRGRDIDLSAMSEADLDEFTNFLYDRFAASRGLIGTPESCAPLVSRLEAIGVTELACLLDFGPDVDLILANLPHLARLKDGHAAPPGHVTAGFDRSAVMARCVTAAPGRWRRDGEALARLVLDPVPAGFQVSPASLDACARVLADAMSDAQSDAGGRAEVTGCDVCEVPGPLTGPVWVHAVRSGRECLSGTVSVYAESGALVARLDGLRLSVSRAPSGGADVAAVLYDRQWETVGPATAATDALGRWWVVADAGGVAADLMSMIEDRGGVCVTAPENGLRGVVYLRGLDVRTNPRADAAELTRAVEHAVQGALLAAQACPGTPIWIVTRGAVAVGESAEDVDAAQAPLWGFGRGVAVERPGGLGALIDLDPATSPAAAAAQLVHVLLGDRRQDMMAFRSDTRYVPRLARLLDRASSTTLHFESDETVLISGGTGGIGLRLAGWLADRGARRLLICGRSAPPAEAVSAFDRLRASGVEVVVVQADVADAAALAAAVGGALNERSRLTGVFHLAGVLDDGQLGDQTWERFAGVFASKVTGAWNLHRLTRDLPVRHFVLFSSVASLLPAPGQAAYAAANAFLDGLAHHRRATGLPALSVNWGPWAEVGHAATAYGRQAHERLASLGIGGLPPDLALRALGVVLERGMTQAAVAKVDWAQLIRTDPAAARLDLLAELVPVGAAAPAGRPHAGAALAEALRALPPDQRRPHLLQSLSDMVVAALKLRTDEPLDARQRLFDVGLDSIMALELKDRLERALGVPLSATLLFVHPTLDALCDHILGLVLPAEPVPVPAPASEDDLMQRLLKEIEASRGA